MIHPRLSMPRLRHAAQSARLLPQSGRWQCPNHSLTSRRHSSQVAPVVKTPFFEVSAEVQDALFAKRPIVALETAIYTHGFPTPDNRLLAAELEAIVRDHGAVPATIGVVEGVARIGISAEQMAILSNSAGHPETMKLSRRDIPYIMGMSIVGKKMNGGTTISGTMMLARKVGIDIIGTGGLGGVHRGAQDTMDISADLTELGRTSVAVVSSGCKSFLDLPRTLEYLETQGVGVFTYADGRTKDIDFPSFFTRDSGIKSPMVFQSPREAAAIIRSQNVLSRYNRSGFLFANPIPEEYSIPKDKIDKAIDQAVQEAAEQGIHGHANTPFILKRIKELTEGNSIPANRALIASNVAMATDIAVELAKLNAEYSTHAPETSTTPGIASAQVRRVSEGVRIRYT